MPGGNYEAGTSNVSYGIVATLASYPTRTALKLPPYLHPAPPPTAPSPHLVSCFAPYTLLHPTSALPLSLCPSTAPRVRLRVRAVSRPSARQLLINIPTALPYRIPFFTVLYWPRPASSAPALFILVSGIFSFKIINGRRRGTGTVLYRTRRSDW